MFAHVFFWLRYFFTSGWRCRTSWITSPSRDLTAHETMGGHTIARHVRSSLLSLRRRLNNEQLLAASSFWDVYVARAAINYAIMAEFEDVIRWLTEGQNRRLRIQTRTPSRASIAYGVVPTDTDLRYSNEVSLILERIGQTFYVVTAFPHLR